MQIRALALEDEEGRWFWRVSGSLFGERFAGEANHFERPNDAARVLAVNALEHLRVGVAQFPQQAVKRKAFQFHAQLGIGRGRRADAFEPGLEIQPRATAKDGQPISSANLADSIRGPPDKLRGI